MIRGSMGPWREASRACAEAADAAPVGSYV